MSKSTSEICDLIQQANTQPMDSTEVLQIMLLIVEKLGEVEVQLQGLAKASSQAIFDSMRF